jgi:thiol-disulfide isomerase/thioredoxin
MLTLSVTASAAGAPSLILDDLRGLRQDLSHHRGHIMVVNFWATWCEPCRKEIPTLVELQERFSAQGLMVVGAAADPLSTRDNLVRYQRKMKMNYPVWVGATSEDMENLGVGNTLPATVILNREGEIVARMTGIVDRTDLEAKVEGLLANSAESLSAEQPAHPKSIHGAATVPS